MESSDGRSSFATAENLFEVDKRVSIIETEVSYIKEDIQESYKNIQKISDVCHGIERHISKQNGILPTIKQNVDIISDKIINFEQQQAKNNTKQKIIWGVLASLLTGAILLGVKITFGI